MCHHFVSLQYHQNMIKIKIIIFVKILLIPYTPRCATTTWCPSSPQSHWTRACSRDQTPSSRHRRRHCRRRFAKKIAFVNITNSNSTIKNINFLIVIILPVSIIIIVGSLISSSTSPASSLSTRTPLSQSPPQVVGENGEGSSVPDRESQDTAAQDDGNGEPPAIVVYIVDPFRWSKRIAR